MILSGCEKFILTPTCDSNTLLMRFFGAGLGSGTPHLSAAVRPAGHAGSSLQALIPLN